MNNDNTLLDTSGLLIARLTGDKELEAFIRAEMEKELIPESIPEPIRQNENTEITDETVYNFLFDIVIDFAILCSFFYSIYFLVYNTIIGQATELYFIWLFTVPFHYLLVYSNIMATIQSLKKITDEN